MAESLVYKPRMDLPNNILFRLSLYYVSTFQSFSSQRTCLLAPICPSDKQF